MSDYPNSGSIGRNTYKKHGSKQPDGKGSAHITCPCCKAETEFEIAAWIRETKSGGKFTNLKFQSAEEAKAQREQRKAQREGQPPPPQDDAPPSNAPEQDDIPF